MDNIEYERKVLFVDDEDLILGMTKSMLEYLGYRAITCNSSQKAISIYKTDSPFYATILDKNMPGDLSGEELLTELLKIDSDIYAILATGAVTKDDKPQNGFKGVLSKPFSIRDLESILSQVK